MASCVSGAIWSVYWWIIGQQEKLLGSFRKVLSDLLGNNRVKPIKLNTVFEEPALFWSSCGHDIDGFSLLRLWWIIVKILNSVMKKIKQANIVMNQIFSHVNVTGTYSTWTSYLLTEFIMSKSYLSFDGRVFKENEWSRNVSHKRSLQS